MTEETEEPLTSISELSTTLGLTTRTLRYWEEVGIIESAERADGAARGYSPYYVRRIVGAVPPRGSVGTFCGLDDSDLFPVTECPCGKPESGRKLADGCQGFFSFFSHQISFYVNFSYFMAAGRH